MVIHENVVENEVIDHDTSLIVAATVTNSANDTNQSPPPTVVDTTISNNDSTGPLIYHRYFHVTFDDAIRFVSKYGNLNSFLELADQVDPNIDHSFNILFIKNVIGKSATRKKFLLYYIKKVEDTIKEYEQGVYKCENLEKFFAVSYCGQTISSLNAQLAKEDCVGSGPYLYFVPLLQVMFDKKFTTRVIFDTEQVTHYAKVFKKDKYVTLTILEWRAIDGYKSHFTTLGANIVNPINQYYREENEYWQHRR